MRRMLLACVVAFVTALTAGVAGAADYRNFVSLTGGVNYIWDPQPSVALRIFEYESETGYGATVGYGTRLGRRSHLVLYGCFGYDRLRIISKDWGAGTEEFYQLRANLRYYFGHVSEKPSGYIGIGPDLMFDENDVGFNANLSLGGDFPVGRGWSILVDGTADLVVAYAHVGLAYWFY